MTPRVSRTLPFPTLRAIDETAAVRAVPRAAATAASAKAASRAAARAAARATATAAARAAATVVARAAYQTGATTLRPQRWSRCYGQKGIAPLFMVSLISSLSSRFIEFGWLRGT